MDRKTLDLVDSLYMNLYPEPIYVDKADYHQLYTALASIEELAYSDRIPDELKENLIAVLDVAYPKIISKE